MLNNVICNTEQKLFHSNGHNFEIYVLALQNGIKVPSLGLLTPLADITPPILLNILLQNYLQSCKLILMYHFDTAYSSKSAVNSQCLCRLVLILLSLYLDLDPPTRAGVLDNEAFPPTQIIGHSAHTTPADSHFL